MATLALSVAGAALGQATLGTGAVLFGMTGGQIGWMAGSILGSQLFAPSFSNEGPRLADLQVSSSTEGADMPILRGSARLPGFIIWADDLKETKTVTKQGGKGGGGGVTTTTYTYSASFAVSFGEFTGAKIRRLWLNKKLVYDVTGKSEQTEINGLSYSFYDGTQTTADPTIEADVGVGNCPAYTGQPLLVFTDLDLTENFGNQIPSVEAEITTLPVTSYDINYYDTKADFDALSGIQDVGGEGAVVWSESVQKFFHHARGDFGSTNQAISIFNPQNNKIEVRQVSLGFDNRQATYFTGISIGDYGTNNFLAISANGNPLKILSTNLSTVWTGGSTSSGGGVRLKLGESKSFFFRIVGGNNTLVQTAKGDWSEVSVSLTGTQGDNFDILNTFVLGPDSFTVLCDYNNNRHFLLGQKSRNGDNLAPWDRVIQEFSVGDGPTISKIGVEYELSYESGYQLPDPKYYALAKGTDSPTSDYFNFPMTGVEPTYTWCRTTEKHWFVTSNLSLDSTRHIFLSRLDVTTGKIDFEVNLYDLGLLFHPSAGTQPSISMNQEANILSTQSNGRIFYINTISLQYGVHLVGLDSGNQFYYHPKNYFIGSSNGTDGGSAPSSCYTRTCRPKVNISGGVPIADIISEICLDAGLDASDIDVSDVSGTVIGFTHTRIAKARADIEQLMVTAQLDAAVIDYKLTFVDRTSVAVDKVIPYDDIGAKEGETSEDEPYSQKFPKATSLPQVSTLQYISFDSVYEPGLARAFWATGSSERQNNIELAIVVDDQQAADLINVIHQQLIDFSTVTFNLTDKYIELVPTSIVTLDLNSRTITLRILKIDHGANGIIKVTAESIDASHFVSYAEAVGKYVPDTTIALSFPSQMYILDTPLLRDIDLDHPGPYLTAANESVGFSSVVWHTSADDQTYNPLESQVSEPTHGIISTVPSAVDFTAKDTTNTLTVELSDSSQSLSSTTEEDVLAGANAFLWGDQGRWEVCQFETATLISGTTYELTNLYRGRRGTDVLMDTHTSSDNFLLLDEVSYQRHVLSASDIGLKKYYKAPNTGTYVTDAESLSWTVGNIPLQPYSVIDLVTTLDAPATNDITMSFTERRRTGGIYGGTNGFADGVGTDPDITGYRFQMLDDLEAEVTYYDVATPSFEYTIAQQRADYGTGAPTVRWRVAPISSLVASLDRYSDISVIDRTGFASSLSNVSADTTVIQQVTISVDVTV